MRGGAGVREMWGRAAPGMGTQRGALIPRLPPEPLGEKEAEYSPSPSCCLPVEGADTLTEKPLAPPRFLAETSGLWTPTGYSGAFLIYFLTHFKYM